MMAVNHKQLNEAIDNGSAHRQTAAIDKARGQDRLSRKQQASLAAAGESEPNRCWYVVEVSYRAQKDVDKSLHDLGVETWVPVEKVKVNRRSRYKCAVQIDVERPIFRGLIFVCIAWSPEVCHSLFTLEGVGGIIGGKIKPKPVSAKEMQDFRGFVALSEKERKKIVSAEIRAARGIEAGDKVKVMDGTMAGQSGMVLSDADPSTVWVQLRMFGGFVPVAVALANLEKSE